MSDSKSGLLAKLANSVNEQGEISGVDSAAVQSLVDVSVSGLINSAPEALNTLDELAAALNDDANFATTVTNSIAAKANSADVYTQAEVDSAIAAIPSFDGNLASDDELRFGPELYVAPTYQRGEGLNTYLYYDGSSNGWVNISSSNHTLQVGDIIVEDDPTYVGSRERFHPVLSIEATRFKIGPDIEFGGYPYNGNIRAFYYSTVGGGTEIPLSISHNSTTDTVRFVSGRTIEITSDVDLGTNNITAANLVTQADIDSAINTLVNAAPEALNTLDELAAALGDDANFATTVTNSLASKANAADVPVDISDLTDTTSLLSSGGGGGVTVYASTAQFPTDAAVGEMAYSSSSKKLYMSAGSGAWDNIALTNLNPVIQGLVESADVTEGAQTFTVTATDPEGFTVTTTANVTGSSVTASYTGNTLTVTPTSTSGISVVQAQASDGSNTATAELFASNNTGAADMGPAPSIRFINDTYDGAVREPALDFGFSADFNRATGDVICAAKYNVTDTSDTNLQYGIYVLNFDGTDFTLNLSSSILDTSTLGFTDRPNPMWISSTEMAIVDADGKIGFFVRDDRNSAWRLNGNVINAISEYSLYSQSFNSIGSVSGVRLDPVTANGDNFGESFVIFHQNGTTKSSLMMGNAIPTENGGFLWFERAGGAGTPWTYNSTLSTNRTVQAQADVAGGHYGYGFDAIAIDGKDPLVLIGVPGNQYEGNSAAKVEIYSPARSAGMVYPSGMSPGPVNGNDSSSFGSAVRFINRDIMAIGAPGENKVYIQQNFKMDSVYFGGGGSMSMYAIGTPEITHPEGGSNFGYRIEVLGENTLLIGDTSSMWLYTLSSNYTATLVHKLTPQAYSISNPVRLAAGMVMHGNANGTVGTNSSGTIDVYTS